MNVQFINNLSANHTDAQSGHSHNLDLNPHLHGGDHGHTHEHLDNAGNQCPKHSQIIQSFISEYIGKYTERDLPDYSSRNFEERGFTVGIGG